MAQIPNDLEKMMNSPQGQQILKNKDALLALANSPDAQKFIKLLKQKSGSELQSAAEAAMKGDTARLATLVNEVTKNPEGAKAVEGLNRKISE